MPATVYAIFTLVPLFWMISSALKRREDVLTLPIKWIPDPVQPQNFYEALFGARFAGYNLATFMLNSLYVAIPTTIISTILCIISGYGFAKFHFRGRDTILWTCLLATLLPFSSVVIPLYIIVQSIGLVDTLFALSIPFLVTGANVFLARQFVIFSVPDEVLEAGRIDGWSELNIFLRIAVPLLKPAIFTIAVLTFTSVWTMFLWPLVVLHDQSHFTLPLGLSLLGLGASFLTEYHLWMAAAAFSIVPIIILFIALRKYYTEGLKVLSGQRV